MSRTVIWGTGSPGCSWAGRDEGSDPWVPGGYEAPGPALTGDRSAVPALVEEAIASGEAKTVLCHTLGLNQSDEIVAEFYFTWSFKPKSK